MIYVVLVRMVLVSGEDHLDMDMDLADHLDMDLVVHLSEVC